MRRRTTSSRRVLPDGTALRNRLLAALPARDYHRICEHLRMHLAQASPPVDCTDRRLGGAPFDALSVSPAQDRSFAGRHRPADRNPRPCGRS